MQKQYKNYVFDLYGTLVDVLTDEESQRLWTSFAWYLKLLGLPAEAGSLRADYLRLCAEAQRAKADMLMAKGIEGPYEADILTVWQALGNEKGMRLTIRQATEISRVFRALSLRRLGLFPGAAEVLGALRAAGKKVILLTNAQSGFTRPELHLLGLDTAFDAIFISGDAGVKKPSPAFFGLLWQTGLREKKKHAASSEVTRETGLQLPPAPQHLAYCERGADSSELSLCGELKPPTSAQNI